MAEPRLQRMTLEEFETWHQNQVERYEFVDGKPKLKFETWDGARMMVGATQAHILVAGNLFAALRQKLKGRACRVFAADGKIATPKGNYRYPDVAVDCGQFEPSATFLKEPRLVGEVLSKGTHWIDTTRKLEEYKTVSPMQHILFVAQDEYRAQLWTRGGDWQLQEFEGADPVIVLSHFGIKLRFAEIYEGIDIGA
jgi:Uma2 family endonuclease